MPSSPRHPWQASLLVLLLIAACAESNLEPENVRPLDPLPIYSSWWGELERCIGETASFQRVTWYEADQLVDRDNGTEHVGAWRPPHTIFIQSGKLLFEAGVKHEMVHDILQTKEHDSPMFLNCAGL
jgi:hypothetical protein